MTWKSINCPQEDIRSLITGVDVTIDNISPNTINFRLPNDHTVSTCHHVHATRETAALCRTAHVCVISVDIRAFVPNHTYRIQELELYDPEDL